MGVNTPPQAFVLLETTSITALPPVPEPFTAMFVPMPLTVTVCVGYAATKLYHTSSSALPPQTPAMPELVALTSVPDAWLPPAPVAQVAAGVNEVAVAPL